MEIMSLSSDASTPNFEDRLFDTTGESSVFLEVTDEPIRQAILSCSTEQSITPLIKQGLKYKIQNRRLSEGKEKLHVRFSPPPVYQLSCDELREVERRKERNRRSAKRSRLFRKAREEQLQATVSELETEKAELNEEVEKLKNMEKELRTILASHLLKCPSYHAKVKKLKQRLVALQAAKKLVQVPTT